MTKRSEIKWQMGGEGRAFDSFPQNYCGGLEQAGRLPRRGGRTGGAHQCDDGRRFDEAEGMAKAVLCGAG